jgi:hypothetical protein
MVRSEVDIKMADHTNIKEALIRALVDAASSQKSVLDPEDREILVKYYMGQITRRELDAFANAKAKRLLDQKDNPQ